MEINYNNKSAFEFYQSIYDDVMQDADDYLKIGLAEKFMYFRLYDGGRYFLFTNQAKYAETSLFTLHEQSPIFMKIIKSLQKEKHDICFIPSVNSDPMIKNFFESQWTNHFGLYYRYSDYIDCIFMASDRDNSFYNGFCTNNTPLLKSLYWLVRDKMNDLVPYDQPGVLSQFRKGADISYQPPAESFLLPSATKKLQDLLDNLSRKKLSLTPREWEVCKGLVRGETSKETARILDIRYRTVEDYLGSMYQKFTVELGYKPTRSQVIQHLHQLLDKDFINQTVWHPTLHK